MNRLCPRIHTLLLLLSVAIGAGACQQSAAGKADAPNSGIQSLVEGPQLGGAFGLPQLTNSERARLADQVKRFYQHENYQLIWIDGEHPSTRYRRLVRVLEEADDHGLPAALYKLPIENPDSKDIRIPPESAAKLDVQTTAAFFRYFTHLTAGRLDPHAIESQWTLKPERPDLVAALTDAVEHNRLDDTIERLTPSSPQYAELQKALVRYRAIAAKGGWPSVTPRALEDVRLRLAAEGDVNVPQEPLIDAIKRFQERHRIKPTGLLTAETIAAMNVPVDDRIRTIELNLERWRWMPDTMPDRYLLVNVPDFQLQAIEHEQSVFTMRVVVGAPDKKTPIFADEMTTVIFSPYWNVPPNIARDETAPRAAQDPGYLDRNNMEVVDGKGQAVDPLSVDWTNAKDLRIRQRPGTGNALGGVKFIFPNNFNVYLHDTNAGKLFDRLERGLSHGCVRVEEPAKLAAYVLRDQPEWTPEAIAEAMQAGRERGVKLTTPLPVYIFYLTASVHEGGVRFLKDIYGHDREQAMQLWPEHS